MPLRAWAASTILILMVLAGRAEAAPGALVGTWSGSLLGQEVTLVLLADGRGQLLGEPITWRSQGATLVVTDAGQDIAYAFQQQGDRLTLSGGDLVMPLAMTRRGGAAAGAASSAGSPERGTLEPLSQDASPSPPPAAPTRAKGPGTTHAMDAWGVTLTVPPAWKAAERDGVLLLGSDTEAGLILVRFVRKTGLEQLRQQYAQGLQEDGARLFPSGMATDTRAGANTAVAGDLAGAAADGTPLQARAIGVASRFGDAVVVLGVTSPQMFAGLAPRVEQVAASLAFTKPKELPAASFLAGQYWYYSGTSGYSTEKKLTLCADGRFNRGGESGGSGQFKNQYGDVTGTYGAVGSTGGQGRWSASGTQLSGTLILQNANGQTDEVPYTVSQDPKDRSGYGPAVNFGGTLYQKTGDGSCR